MRIISIKVGLSVPSDKMWPWFQLCRVEVTLVAASTSMKLCALLAMLTGIHLVVSHWPVGWKLPERSPQFEHPDDVVLVVSSLFCTFMILPS